MADYSSSNRPVNTGWVWIGFILAFVLSVTLNHSLWWGLLHFFLGWFYVLYVLLVRSCEIELALKSMFGI